MSSMHISMGLLSVIFGISTFAALDCTLRVREWDVLNDKNRAIFWADIRDIGFKISMITLLSSVVINSICDSHFQLFHFH